MFHSVWILEVVVPHNDHKHNCIFHCHVDSVCHRSSLVRFYLSHNYLIDVFDFISFSFYGILVYCRIERLYNSHV